MPIYEYVCLECGQVFDEMRSFSQADAPIQCEACSSDHTSRKISLFYASSEGRSVAGPASSCGTCSSTACGSCSLKH